MGTLIASESPEVEVAEESIHYREPLAPLGSQMTVPETPSPDLLEYK